MQKINVSTLTQALVSTAYIVLITLSPSIRFIPYIEYHDCQRILQLLLLAIILIDAVLLIFSKKSSIAINNKLKIGFYFLIILAIASSVRSIEPRQAVIEVTIFISLCYLSLFVARVYREAPENFIKHLTYVLLASILLYMFSFYVGFFTALAVGKKLVWPLPFYGFNNIRIFQQYQLWGLGLISLPLLAFELKKIMRIWLYLLIVTWYVLLFYAGSRGVILGWLLAMSVTAIVYRKAAWPFLMIQFLTAFLGLALYYLLFHLVPLWLSPDSIGTNTSSIIVSSTIFRDTSYDRLDLWKVAYVMIKNFPLLGVGPMHFYFYNSFGTHPHNSVLQLAAEWGLPATFIILTILGYSFSCWYKKFNTSKLQTATKLDSNLSIILFFTIIANGAYSLVEGVIVMPISQILMFTMIGLMIGQYTIVQVAPVKTSNIGFRPIFATLVLGLMTFSVMPELLRGLTSYERYYQPGERAFSMGPEVINPRIWMQQRRIEPNAKKIQENDTN